MGGCMSENPSDPSTFTTTIGGKKWKCSDFEGGSAAAMAKIYLCKFNQGTGDSTMILKTLGDQGHPLYFNQEPQNHLDVVEAWKNSPKHMRPTSSQHMAQKNSPNVLPVPKLLQGLQTVNIRNQDVKAFGLEYYPLGDLRKFLSGKSAALRGGKSPFAKNFFVYRLHIFRR